MSYKVEQKIYYRDTDCGGVVYYSRYLEYFEIARTEYLGEMDINVPLLAEEGILFVVKTAQLDYVSPAVYGDTILISTDIIELKSASMVFEYSIYKGSNVMLVKGTTKLVCVGRDMKPMKLPELVYNKMKSNIKTYD